MIDCKDDTNEIEIKSDGSWRVKTSGQFKDLEKWHLPDGSLCPTPAAKSCFSLHAGSKTKHEMFPETDQGETKPSIQKLQSETKIPKIESAVGSFCPNGQGSQVLEKEMEVELIVLSDSDDDNVTILDPPLVNEPPLVNGGTGFTTCDPSCLELLTGGPDDFDLSYWDYPQAGSPAGQQFLSEEQHQVQNGGTVALNGNAIGQDINSNGTSDYTDYWSSFNLQERGDLMDLDSANRPGPSGNLTDENGTAQPIVDAGKSTLISRFLLSCALIEPFFFLGLVQCLWCAI
jgi:hypothetical protein